MSAPSKEWLEKTNAQFGRENVEHRQRPWLAWRKWGMESGQSLALSDPSVKQVFAWFTEHTKADSQLIGDLYVGTFFYDAEIWPVVVPVFYGTVELRPLDSLRTMPESVKARLQEDERAWAGFVATFADCVDVGLLLSKCASDAALSSHARKWLASGGETLSAAAELLLLKRPNPKALGTALMATEIILKAYLAAKDNLNEEDAKNKYGHKLPKLMKRVLEVTLSSDFAEIAPKVTVFPPVEERYDSNQWPILTLWNGYSLALRAAATAVRLITGEDCRRAMR
jgi:hypothetical protein